MMADWLLGLFLPKTLAPQAFGSSTTSAG